MNFQHFIGIDVSKNQLDFVVVKENKQVFYLKTDNSKKGIASFFAEFKKLTPISYDSMLFCMEHTGIYNNHLLDYLFDRKVSIWLESAVHIKQSIGMQRGKNDKVDASRIAMYAYKNREDVKLWQPEPFLIQKLKYLTTTRTRLITVVKQLKTPINEFKGYVDKSILKSVKDNCKNTLKGVERDLQNIEKEIDLIITSDAELNRLFNIITSVPGIGKVIGAELIINTNKFSKFKDSKKFACNAGIAPFENQSGSSLRGKARVSNLANKRIKQLLHMAALVAVQYDEEIKKYFDRKVSEGKSKMSVLNAVRNKLVHRIFVCVNQNRNYEKNYINSLA
ncbi:MAG: Transposase family protein [Segetibacter sp.]|nr:Transposase family protein [Segetibacter sp.]